MPPRAARRSYPTTTPGAGHVSRCSALWMTRRGGRGRPTSAALEFDVSNFTCLPPNRCNPPFPRLKALGRQNRCIFAGQLSTTRRRNPTSWPLPRRDHVAQRRFGTCQIRRGGTIEWQRAAAGAPGRAGAAARIPPTVGWGSPTVGGRSASPPCGAARPGSVPSLGGGEAARPPPCGTPVSGCTLARTVRDARAPPPPRPHGGHAPCGCVGAAKVRGMYRQRLRQRCGGGGGGGGACA